MLKEIGSKLLFFFLDTGKAAEGQFDIKWQNVSMVLAVILVVIIVTNL